MRVVVCVKQVPDTGDVRIDPDRGTLIREGIASVLNPLDSYAVETAVRLARAHGGSAIALSMGPPQAEAVCREAIARGCDEAVLLTDRVFAGADTWATSHVLARAIDRLGAVDLVLCGKMAVDGDTAQVGPGIATHLGWPQAIDCKAITAEDGAVHATVLTDQGDEDLRLPTPALCTVLKEACIPRLSDLVQAMHARRTSIPHWDHTAIGADPARCGLEGSPTRVVEIFTPPARGECQMLFGDPADTVPALMRALASREPG
ncbi:MAG: electron transfer flavoprotein subunit beta/FixA family protein [Planctomycetota bacterium]